MTELKREEVTTFWKLVNKEVCGGYTYSLFTCQIDIGVILMTVIEKDGTFVNSHQTVMTKPQIKNKAEA